MSQEAQATPPRLSVVLIARNEAHQIERCLRSVAFADEIVLVDNGSTDGTQARAAALGARVIETADWPGFGVQKQRALDAARGQWVLSLDADEWLDDELARAVQQVVAAAPLQDAPAYQVQRKSAFCGQWMRASGWFPDPTVRLFPRGAARFSADLVHEHLIVQATVQRLPGLLLHDSIPTLDIAIDKMARYSSGRARDLHARGRRGGLGRALGHGLWAFVRTYLLKRGFLDGRLGLVLAIHNAETTYYRYLKLWLLQRGEAPPAG